MYQVTFIRKGQLHSVTSPNKRTMELLALIIGGSRIWQNLGKGNWQLIN